MLDKILEKLKNDLAILINSFKKELLKYSLNKINISILENLPILYYDSYNRLTQIASITIENNIVIIKPFDKKLIPTIQSEIIKLNIDLNPTTHGDTIKLIYPKSTIERRNLFIKKVKELSENYKINIRNIRRDANNTVKSLTKNKDISQDTEKRSLLSIQKHIDDTINDLEQLLTKKIAELNKI